MIPNFRYAGKNDVMKYTISFTSQKEIVHKLKKSNYITIQVDTKNCSYKVLRDFWF